MADKAKAKALKRSKKPFWKTKSLGEMSREEWESLCDGCGRCCMVKLEDDDTSEIYLTKLSCRLLDVKSCRCSNYETRFEKMHDCVEITQEKLGQIKWLPATCAYKVLAEGGELAWWHPLVSGDPATVHKAGISVRGLAKSEARVQEANYWRYIIPAFEKA